MIKANKRLLKKFTPNQVHFRVVGFLHINGLVAPNNIPKPISYIQPHQI